MQRLQNVMHKSFFALGDRLAFLLVIIVFCSLFFLESVHPAFSQEEDVQTGYSKNGLTYDLYLNISYSEEKYPEIKIEKHQYFEERVIEHFKFSESSVESELQQETDIVVEVEDSDQVQTFLSQEPVGDEVWEELAQCESGGNWSINTGNGYYGGLQFSEGAWGSVGGVGLPSEASREEQIERGKKLQAVRGWGAWGACAKRLGL